jgi:rhomboid family GlyGly-CTERM serine protease
MLESYFLKPIRDYNAARALRSPYSAALLVGLASFWVQMAFPELKYVADSPIFWRFFTAIAAQLAHLSVHHLILNIAAMGMITWGLAPWWSSKQWLGWATISAACVALGLILTPNIQWYVGLSGMLHGLLVAGLVHILFSHAATRVKTIAAIILLSVLIKLYIEAYWGGLWLDATSMGGPVLPEAHRFGALGVLLVATMYHALYRAINRGPLADRMIEENTVE